ncbi:MAG: TetR/AcrR family transcriptional regulator [Planctomycetota bacterium]
MASSKPTPKPRASRRGDTRERALQVAVRLMQTRGYHGFTFQDVAQELGVSHVAVHHHYRTKADLVAAAMRVYTDGFDGLLEEIASSETEPRRMLKRYAGLFEATAADSETICLCGALAADFATLPEAVQPEIVRFYEHNERWLQKVIASALGTRSGAAKTRRMARGLVDALEGAMVSARAFGDPSRVSSLVRLLLESWFAA